MTIFTDIDSLMDLHKKSKLEAVGAKDHIYCFNKNGNMIDISYVSVVSQIKATVTFIPCDASKDIIMYLAGKENSSTIYMQFEKDTDEIKNALNRTAELLNDKFQIVSKIDVKNATREAAKSRKNRKSESAVPEKTSEIKEQEEEQTVKSEEDIINEIINSASDSEIGLPLLVKLKLPEKSEDTDFINSLKEKFHTCRGF